jgi:hypothetical protein
MSSPGLDFPFEVPVTDLPAAYAEFVPGSGVAPIIEAPSVEQTYLMVAKPYDPNNYNLLHENDDPNDTAFWEDSDCTMTLGKSDPFDGTDAWEVDKSAGTSNRLWQDISWPDSDNLDLVVRVWVLAGGAGGGDDEIEIGLRDDTHFLWLPVKSVKLVSGHLAALSINDNAVITGLSQTTWSEIEIVWDTFSVPLDCYVAFIPAQISATAGIVQVFRPQLQYVRTPNTFGYVSTDVRKTEAINGPEGAPGQEITLRYSNNGWASASTDIVAHKLYLNALHEPYKLRVAPFVGADMLPRLTPNRGEIIIGNTDYQYDYLLDLSWDNREIILYQGLWDYTFEQFKAYSKGSATGIDADQYTLTIHYSDAMQLLDKDIQPDEFKGLGMALRFDGTGDYVGMGANGWTWTLEDDVTLEVIARFYSDPGKKVVFFDKSTDFAAEEFNRNYSLRYDCTNNRLEYEHEYSTSIQETVNSGSGTVPTDNKSDGFWHHYAVKRDTTLKELYFYVDGEEIANTTYTNQPTGGWRGGCRIGRDDATNAWDLEGDIAEFRIFRSLRDDKDIKKYFEQSLTDTEDEDLVGLWRLNEGLGQIAGNELYDKVWHASGKSDGVDDGATTDSSPTISLPGSWTMAVWLQMDGQDNQLTFIFGQPPAASTQILLRTSDNAPGNLQWQIKSSTGSQFNGGTGWSFQNGKLLCMVLTFDDDNDLVTSYVNYDEKVQSWEYVRSGDFDLNQLALGSNASITSNYFGGQVFQAAIFSRAFTTAEVKEMYDFGVVDLSDADLEVAYDFETWSDLSPAGKDFTTTTGVVLLNSNGTLNPYTGDPLQPEWIGSGEGGLDMLGKAKPTITGRVHHVEPLLLDPFNWVYYIAEGPLNAVETVYEGGDEMTVELTTSNDIWSVSPTLDYVVNLDSGLMKAKSIASYPVTVDVKGDRTDGYRADAGAMIKQIITRRSEISWPDEFNLDTFDNIDQGTALGLYTGIDNLNIIEAINTIMGSIHGAAFMDRAARVAVAQIPALVSTDIPVFEITEEMIEQGSVELFQIIPSWRENIHYAPYWRTLSDQEVVGTASGKKSDLAKQFRTVYEDDDAIEDAWKSTEIVDTETLIYSEAGATREATARFERFTVPRRLVSFTMPIGLVGVNVGEVGRVHFARWDMPVGGFLVYVAEYEEDLTSQRIQVKVWL